MKISLLETNISKYSYYKYINYAATILNVGLPTIAAVLRNEGHDTRIYIRGLSRYDLNDILDSDIIGISLMTPTVMEHYEFVRSIKHSKKNVPIIMGGPHATFMPDEVLDYADFVIRGEGEQTIRELVRAIEGDKAYDSIRGLSYWENGNKKHNLDRETLEDLDSLPFPDYTTIEGFNRITKKKSFVPTILTSRGCPFNCKFCSSVKMFGRKFRT